LPAHRSRVDTTPAAILAATIVARHAYFANDSIGLRCTWRFGQNVVRPARIGKFTVT